LRADDGQCKSSLNRRRPGRFQAVAEDIGWIAPGTSKV